MQYVNPWHETGVTYFAEEMPRLPISRSPREQKLPSLHSLPPTHTQVWAGWVSFTQQPSTLHSSANTHSKAGAHLYFSLCRILTLQRSSCPWLPHRQLQRLSTATNHITLSVHTCTHCTARPSAPSICWATCCFPLDLILSLSASLKTERMKKAKMRLKWAFTSVCFLLFVVCETSANVQCVE